MLARFFSEATIDDADYKYSQSGVYFAPDFDTLDEYLEYVGHLPIEDSPEIFGMHNNANLAFQVILLYMLSIILTDYHFMYLMFILELSAFLKNEHLYLLV